MHLVSYKTITQSLPKTSKLYVFCSKSKRHWPGRPWPRGHSLMSLKSRFLENCLVVVSRTAVFFELLKFWRSPEKNFRRLFFWRTPEYTYENICIYICICIFRRVPRNSQWEGCFWGLGAEPPALENFAFFCKK